MEAAQPPSPAPARRIGVGDVISETFSIFGQHLVALFGSALAVFIVVGLVTGILQRAGGVLLLLLAAAVSLAGRALYTGFVVALVQDVRDGRRDQTVGDLFSAAAPFILPLIGFGILFGIGAAIGFLLIIIPGLILVTFWSLGAPAIVVEGVGPIEAFGRSWRLVRGNAWQVFGVLLITFVIVVVIQIVLAAIANSIGNGEVSTWIASIISGMLTAPIFSIAVTVMYFELAGETAVPQAAAAPAPPPLSEPPPPPPPAAS
jgi:hypothetical protein